MKDKMKVKFDEVFQGLKISAEDQLCGRNYSASDGDVALLNLIEVLITEVEALKTELRRLRWVEGG